MDTLKKAINDGTEHQKKLWQDINETNIYEVASRKYNDNNLYQYLLLNKYFKEADFILPFIDYMSDSNILTLTNVHRQIYNELIVILTSDELIYKIESFNDSETDDEYRLIIAKKLETLDSDTMHPFMKMSLDFKFLTSELFYDFYANSINEKMGHYHNQFVIKYTEFISIKPIVIKMINEYYILAISDIINKINDLENAPPILLAECYDQLIKEISELPMDFISFNYQSMRTKENIPIIVTRIPKHNINYAKLVIKNLFMKTIDIYPNVKDMKGNTILHHIAMNGDHLFYTYFYKSLLENMPLTDRETPISLWLTQNIIDILLSNNDDGKNVIDLLIDNNSYSLLMRMIEFFPVDAYKKISHKLIEQPQLLNYFIDDGYRKEIYEIIALTNDTDTTFCETNKNEIVNEIDDNLFQNIYLNCIESFLDEMLKMKKNIFYDRTRFDLLTHNLIKLINKIKSYKFDKNYGPHYWLMLCIEIDLETVFDAILQKFFNNENNKETREMIDCINSRKHITLISMAIMKQNIFYIKKIMIYQPNLQKNDDYEKNPLIYVLETKNVNILQYFQNKIKNGNKCMNKIFDDYIQLLDVRQNIKWYPLSVMQFLTAISDVVRYLLKY